MYSPDWLDVKFWTLETEIVGVSVVYLTLISDEYAPSIFSPVLLSSYAQIFALYVF